MNIKTIKELKIQAEKEILLTCLNFETETGLRISKIEMTELNSIRQSEPNLLSISLDIRIT